MSNNRSTASLFVHATALAIGAAAAMLFVSLACAETSRSSDFIFFHGNVGELSVFNLSKKDLKETPWVVYYENGGVIDEGLFPNVPPLHGAVVRFTSPASVTGGTPVVTFPNGFNPCDAMLSFVIKAVSSTAPTLPPEIVTEVVDRQFPTWDFGRPKPCPETDVKRTNPNGFLTPGPIAVTPATNLNVALHNTDDVTHTYCIQLRATDDGGVVDQKSATVDGGNTGILTFSPPFPSVESVVPVVSAQGNPVSVNFNILQTVVVDGGHTELRSDQVLDSLNRNTLDSALTPPDRRCD